MQAAVAAAMQPGHAPVAGIAPQFPDSQDRDRMSKRQVLPPDKSVAFLIRRAHLAFDRLLTARLSEHGIKTGFWYYLRALWIEEGVSQKHLSHVTNVTEGTTVSLLNDMSTRGLIRRERDTIDRRQVFVSLTPKGRSLESQLLPKGVDLINIALRGIPKEDVAVCMDVLHKVADNLEAEFQNGAEAEAAKAPGATRRRTTQRKPSKPR
jgi:DNA-binding MarR family transcriptional regulator